MSASPIKLVGVNQFGEVSVSVLQSTGAVFAGDFALFSGATAPVDGTSGSGAGFAGPGSLYTAQDTGKGYLNGGTKASPAWKIITSA